MLEEFLEKNAGLFQENYLTLKIDTTNMHLGTEVARELRKESGGIPWMVILDGDGKELITSDGPRGNIGCPIRSHEIKFFLTMIQETWPTVTDEQLEAIGEALERNAAKYT